MGRVLIFLALDSQTKANFSIVIFYQNKKNIKERGRKR